MNVPVGIAAVIAGRYLLPRTRQFSPRERFDWPGTALLVAWTSALLLVLSAASGLNLPFGTAALLAVLGVVGLGAFVRREIRTEHPLIPVWLLRSAPLALALAGAACGYLTLFGPLVLVPQILGHGPGGVARAGLLLSALPLGFGVAALFGDAVLPEGWGNRRRGFAGAALTGTVMCASIFMPVTHAGAARVRRARRRIGRRGRDRAGQPRTVAARASQRGGSVRCRSLKETGRRYRPRRYPRHRYRPRRYPRHRNRPHRNPRRQNTQARTR